MEEIVSFSCTADLNEPQKLVDLVTSTLNLGKISLGNFAFAWSDGTCIAGTTPGKPWLGLIWVSCAPGSFFHSVKATCMLFWHATTLSRTLSESSISFWMVWTWQNDKILWSRSSTSLNLFSSKGCSTFSCLTCSLSSVPSVQVCRLRPQCSW